MYKVSVTKEYLIRFGQGFVVFTTANNNHFMVATINIRKNLWLQTQFFCASSFPDAVPCARGDGRLWLPKWKGTTKLDDLSGDALCGCGDGRRWLPKREGTTKWEDLPAPQPRGTRRSCTKRHSTARKAHTAKHTPQGTRHGAHAAAARSVTAAAARSATAAGHEASAARSATAQPAGQ